MNNRKPYTNEPLWISVKDKMPEENKRVLVYCSDMENSDVGSYSIQWGWMCYSLIHGITHWMELPEPPEGKTDI